MGDEGERYVFVELEEVGFAAPPNSFEICISATSEGLGADTSLVVQSIISQNQKLCDLLTHGEVQLKTESTRFQNKFIDLKSTAKISSNSYLKCFVTRKTYFPQKQDPKNGHKVNYDRTFKF